LYHLTKNFLTDLSPIEFLEVPYRVYAGTARLLHKVISKSFLDGEFPGNFPPREFLEVFEQMGKSAAELG